VPLCVYVFCFVLNVTAEIVCSWLLIFSDGRQFIIPNSLVYSHAITQYKRSRDYAVTCQLQVGFETNAKQMDELRHRTQDWLNKDSSLWKAEEFMMWVSDIQNMNKLTLEFRCDLRGVNWQTPMKWIPAKTMLLLNLQTFCKELKINYSLPEQPVTIRKNLTSDVTAADSAAQQGAHTPGA